MALATAQRDAGQFEQSASTLRIAADIARREDDPSLLARAALTLADHRRINSRADPSHRRLLEESLARLDARRADGDADPRGEPPGRLVGADGELRTRLLAALAEQLAVDGRLDDAVRAGSEAESAAQLIGSAPAEVEALAAGLAALTAPRQAVERLALAAALCGRVRDASVAPATLDVADQHRIHALVELGEWPAGARAMAGYAERASRSEPAHPRWFAAQYAVCRATVEGRLRDVDALVHATLAPGEQAVGRRIAESAAVMHLLVPRWMQGRLADVAGAAQQTGAQLGWPPRSRSVDAMLAAHAGDRERARRTILSLVGSFGELPMNTDWVATIFYLVAALRRLRLVEPARALRREIAPLVGRDMTFAGLVYYGAYGHHLGVLDAICGRIGEASVQLRAALEHYEAIGAHPWAALARADLARTLSTAAPTARRLAGEASERAAPLTLDLQATAYEVPHHARA